MSLYGISKEILDYLNSNTKFSGPPGSLIPPDYRKEVDRRTKVNCALLDYALAHHKPKYFDSNQTNRKDSNMFEQIPNPKELDRLAVAMKKRLAEKHGAGFTGWDSRSFALGRNKERIIEHAGRIAAGQRKEVDLANHVMFSYNFFSEPLSKEIGESISKLSSASEELCDKDSGKTLAPLYPQPQNTEELQNLLKSVYTAQPGITILDVVAGIKYTKQVDGTWLKGNIPNTKKSAKRKTLTKGKRPLK